MCGGESATLAAAVPVLRDVASKWVHVGAVGTATRVKLIGNTFIGLMLEALCEGFVLCTKAGIDPKKLLEVVQASGYQSPYWEFKAKPMLARDFETHFSIDLMHKDLTLALAAANDLKAAVPGLAMVREQFQQARAAGHGGEDIAALIKVLETQSGVGP
jgi:3-hydroxyisobutyrate dehydrogenase-like beta-hydroxyacid dehydrogenase